MTFKPRNQSENAATSVAAKSKGKGPKARGAKRTAPGAAAKGKRKRTVFTAVKSHPILTAAGALALGVGAYALTKSGSKASKRGRKRAGK